MTASTPPLIASRRPRSAGLIASSARTCAVTGSVRSLVSCPAQRLELEVPLHRGRILPGRGQLGLVVLRRDERAADH
ncbi:MAG: hypothetical protein ACRDPF_21750, partial [Streptosporangiaceae bacterium]